MRAASAKPIGAAAGEAKAVLLAYLTVQALAPYWHSVLTQAEADVNGPVLDFFLTELKAARVSSAISYMAQRATTRAVIADVWRALAAIRRARQMAAADPVLTLMRDGQQSVG